MLHVSYISVLAAGLWLDETLHLTLIPKSWTQATEEILEVDRGSDIGVIEAIQDSTPPFRGRTGIWKKSGIDHV